MSTRKLFRSKKVLLEDGLQEAGILVGEEGKIDKILRKDELGTLQHTVEVSMYLSDLVTINCLHILYMLEFSFANAGSRTV